MWNSNVHTLELLRVFVLGVCRKNKTIEHHTVSTTCWRYNGVNVMYSDCIHPTTHNKVLYWHVTIPFLS